MRRILQVEMDAQYFDRFAESFLKSFYAYNRGWNLYVVDLGLRSEQRDLLSRYGVVESYRADSYRRWIQMSARLDALAKIVKDGDLVLHSDVDLVVLDNYEDVVNELFENAFSCHGASWGRPVSEFLRYQRGVAEMLGVDEDSQIFSTHRLHFGWLLMRGTPAVHSALCWLHENWEQFSAYAGEEETAMTCLFRARGLRIGCNQFVDCTCFSHPKPSSLLPAHSPPARCKPAPSRLVHFATCKYFMEQSTARNHHENWMAWKDVLLKPYASLPWPLPEEVCESG